MMKTERISFTLIELLIVIAIIAILAGMLLPALGKARAKGKQTLCTSNMKQLSTTVNMYCDDWKEYFPAYISADFFRQVEPYARRKWVAWQSQTIADAGPFWCPEDQESVRTKTTLFSYGCNVYTSSNIASGYDDAHAKDAFSARKNIRRPTNIIYSGDSFHKDAYQVILDQNAFPFSGNKAPDQNRVATGLSFRHLLSVNILYVDSHITPRNYSYLNSTRNTYFTKND